MNQFSRTQMLLGKNSISSLQTKHVIIFGLGGVGGYVAEALARSGLGEISLVDNDVISESNINRQIIALHSTLGKYKVDVIEERLKDINPSIIIHKHKSFYLPERKNDFDFSIYDFIIDCVDTIAAKISIIEEAYKMNKKIITSMGTGNKLDPMAFMISDIEKTSVCPLARVIRQELKKKNIKGIKCVYSQEKAAKIIVEEDNSENTPSRHSPASVSWTPAAAGLLIASHVVLQLTSLN